MKNMYMADFETTVDEDTSTQEYTEVWAYGIARLFDNTDTVHIGNNIKSFLDFFKFGKKTRKLIYFTNMKFDCSFIVDYLTRQLNYKCAYDIEKKEFLKDRELKPGQFVTTITDLGIWYVLVVNYEGYLLEFRCTLKLLPFSVEALGEAFDTKHRKLHIDYKGNMKAYGEITDEQKAYITNDILVPKEALEKFLTEINGIEKPPLTIGQSALNYFKEQFTFEDWQLYFPNLCDVKLDKDLYGSDNADSYIRMSYGGGWCYADENYTGIVNGKTYVYDVNSLYPAMLYYNSFPIGLPTFTKDIRDLKNVQGKYYFIRFRCNFELKSGYLPFIQLKHDLNFRSNENLFSSRWDRFGNRLKGYKVEMTLSCTMFNLFVQCYNIKDFEFLDGCIFNTEDGIFRQYVSHFMQLKEMATKSKNKVKRTIAKLYLNALCGKFGKNPLNCFKVPEYSSETEEVKYNFDEGELGKPVYIPIASAVTSYARCYTIRSALKNKEYFRYSDTDSIHLVLLDGVEPKGIEVHDTKLGAWKLESVSDHSLFLRQKTYIEFSGDHYDIKACGLPERSKILFEENLKGNYPDGDILNIPQYNLKGEIFDYQSILLSKKEVEFMSRKRTVNDFKIGFSVPGKLVPKIIKGGTVLEEVDFTIK